MAKVRTKGVFLFTDTGTAIVQISSSQTKMLRVEVPGVLPVV